MRRMAPPERAGAGHTHWKSKSAAGGAGAAKRAAEPQNVLIVGGVPCAGRSWAVKNVRVVAMMNFFQSQYVSTRVGLLSIDASNHDAQTESKPSCQS